MLRTPFFRSVMHRLARRRTISPYSIRFKAFTKYRLSQRLLDHQSMRPFSLQAILHGFFDFENFDLDDYEHHEVTESLLSIHTNERSN